MFNHASSGHPGGSISSGRIVESLLFNQMDYDISNPMDRTADIISYAAGHKALGLYAMWALPQRNRPAGNTPDLLPEVASNSGWKTCWGSAKTRLPKPPCSWNSVSSRWMGTLHRQTPFVWFSTGPSGVGVAARSAWP